MNDRQETDLWQEKRRRAVRTAIWLGTIAVLIFAAFFASGVIGR
jgi:hypothetical protein